MCCSSPSGTSGFFIRPMIAIPGRAMEDVSTPGSGGTSDRCLLWPITAGLREIHRELSLHEMAAILRESEVFYSYDETVLIHSATLCGCPAVLLPSDKFRDCHTLEDMGLHGIAETPEELARAQATVAERLAALSVDLSGFPWSRLDHFIDLDAEPRIVARGNGGHGTDAKRQPSNNEIPSLKQKIAKNAKNSYIRKDISALGMPYLVTPPIGLSLRVLRVLPWFNRPSPASVIVP